MMSCPLLIRIFCLAVFLGLTACSDPPEEISRRELTVACGMCRFDMADKRGCYWAVEIEGQHYVVGGSLPQDHQNHAPDGMCNMQRRAVVEGKIQGPRFVASHFELLPAGEIPTQPRFTPSDNH